MFTCLFSGRHELEGKLRIAEEHETQQRDNSHLPDRDFDVVGLHADEWTEEGDRIRGK